MKTYYKVVSFDLKSYLYKHLPKEFVVKYEIGEWVYPKVEGTKLMVFNNLKDARKFCYFGSHVYNCMIENPSCSSVFVPYIGSIHSASVFLRKWNLIRKKQKQHKKFFEKKAVPKGTVFVSAVKLLKRVYLNC